MSKSIPDQRQQPHLPERLDFSLFDADLHTSPRVIVVLDRQQPRANSLSRVEIETDSDCACE
jgi:hypothetical protein